MLVAAGNKDILDSLKDNHYYSRADLLKLIHEKRPDYSTASCCWVLSSLLKDEAFVRIGRGAYLKLVSASPSEEKPLKEGSAQAVRLLEKSFPEAKIVAFDSSLLNEWLNELIAHSTTVIEMDPSYLEDAYYLLKSKTKMQILLRPNEKEMTHYRNDETILLEPLRSRSPLKRQGTGIRLEKLMVDLLADDFFAYFYSPSELPDVYEAISKNNIIDTDTLFAYAKRRLVYDRLTSLLPPRRSQPILQKDIH
jgi:hypothetical protein